MVNSNIVWKTLYLKGEYYNRYLVSEEGIVWDTKRDAEVSQVLSGKPQYLYVNLTNDEGVRVNIKRVNLIVTYTFHGDPPTKQHTSDHKDRDKLNNHKDNLRWLCREGQAANRDCTILTSCGTPVTQYLKDRGYDINNSVIGKFLSANMQKGFSYQESIFRWANHLSPSTTLTKIREFKNSYEFGNVWYPNTESLVNNKGNCSADTFLGRLKGGMTIEGALNYEHDPCEIYRFEMDGFHMTKEEHCERLCVSYQRVTAYMKKHNMSFEEALNVPVQRVIKHNINGVTKRNSDWYEQFNIPSRTANSWLNRSKYGNERTFRDVLDKYNINTENMEIYPCDGDVVMYNNPL